MSLPFFFDGSPARILIGNDQEWSARSLESVLAPLGCEVTRAFTGRQVLEAATTQPIDLVLLDTQLPDIHGFDVCRELRSPAYLGPSTPIVMTTSGPAGRAQRLEASLAGAWDFLSEPVDIEVLTPRLSTFIEAKRKLVIPPNDGHVSNV